MPDEISAIDTYERKRVAVEGTELAYVDTGEGDPFVFLHGNPTSSYLWRNVIPHVEPHGRCLAPDLVGMGDSGPAPDGGYRFVDHAKYLDAWSEAVLLGDRITLVIHDWGSALGFDWARRHEERVRAIVFMESIIAPFPGMPPEGTMFNLLRGEQDEQLVLEENYFIEQVLGPRVTPEALERYRLPYLDPGQSRMPTLIWPREVPFKDGPEDNAEVVRTYAKWLQQTQLPKLFIRAEPGAILRGPALDLARSLPNVTEATVEGTHFVQEQSPDAIGEAIAAWLQGVL
ncbi:MAG TPA: haloalkane dehalogenase [Dehalococcoidia bacterium]|jgi:haloalkane dehalogenase|nr:haloalkane dehalogenase [Dehalococcoidia bacterium]